MAAASVASFSKSSYLNGRVHRSSPPRARSNQAASTSPSRKTADLSGRSCAEPSLFSRSILFLLNDEVAPEFPFREASYESRSRIRWPPWPVGLDAGHRKVSFKAFPISTITVIALRVLKRKLQCYCKRCGRSKQKRLQLGQNCKGVVPNIGRLFSTEPLGVSFFLASFSFSTFQRVPHFVTIQGAPADRTAQHLPIRLTGVGSIFCLIYFIA